MRLIDAEALKSDFQDRLRKAKNWKENALNKGDNELVIRAEATIDFICEVIMTIDNAPTVEIPHGEWISQGNIGGVINRGRRCSVCGKIVEFSENFCPGCGADMRGE